MLGSVRGALVLAASLAAVVCGSASGRERATPAPQPPGALVLAQQSGGFAVALAVAPGRRVGLTATVIGPSGARVSGLRIRLAGRAALACGPGCYRGSVALPRPRRIRVEIHGAGAPRSLVFALGAAWPPRPAGPFLGRASRVFRALRSTVFLEHLSSGPGYSTDTTWKLVAPDRLRYDIRGGPSGIVIGRRRWDRPAPGEPWTSSETVRLRQPTSPWGTRIANAHVLAQTPRTLTVSWLDPVVPAWFTATFDRRTALPETLRMTAPAHFMRHRYVSFNRVVRIAPPTR
jgi:hypothetical protein